MTCLLCNQATGSQCSLVSYKFPTLHVVRVYVKIHCSVSKSSCGAGKCVSKCRVCSVKLVSCMGAPDYKGNISILSERGVSNF